MKMTKMLKGPLAITLLCLISGIAYADCNNTFSTSYKTSAASEDNSGETADFTWHQSTKGKFSASITHSFRPEDKCKVCVFSRVKLEGEDEAKPLKVVRCKRSNRKIVKFKANAMPGVPSDALMNLATRTTCDDEVIESNVFARNPTCGFASTSASAARWVQLLRERIK